ncbi:hypothetical protein VNO77_21953 [Canavalia gladiata]|uniref:Uncharacterized protein n=1 Tax=Canavalia gladiata TaxID=3824 RepID=A0AAN9Q7L2_CANGL
MLFLNKGTNIIGFIFVNFVVIFVLDRGELEYIGYNGIQERVDIYFVFGDSCMSVFCSYICSTFLFYLLVLKQALDSCCPMYEKGHFV